MVARRTSGAGLLGDTWHDDMPNVGVCQSRRYRPICRRSHKFDD